MGLMSRFRAVADIANSTTRPALMPRQGGDVEFSGEWDVSSPVASPEILSAFGISFFGSAALTRDAACAVPAVARSRNVICGSVAQLPLHAFNAAKVKIESALLAQPERGIARAVTIAKTVDDLLFHGASYWLVVERTPAGFPRVVQHFSPPQVGINSNGTYNIEARTYRASDVIQFLSPGLPLLKYGRAIKAASDLETIAALVAQEGSLRGYFTPADGEDPDITEVVAAINQFIESRKVRSFGYVPSALKFIETDPDASKLGLAEARQHAALEVGRLTGLSAHRLGISVQSETYQNVESDNLALYRETLMPFILAIEERLSMNDVCPNGQYVKLTLDAFLRPDTSTRYAAYANAIQSGVLTVNEARSLEDLPPLPEAEGPGPAGGSNG